MLATSLKMVCTIYFSIIESLLVAVRRVGCTFLSLSRSICEQTFTKAIHTRFSSAVFPQSLQKLQQASALVAGVCRSVFVQVG